MSKINAVRFINLNYNNNAIRISDETFQMQGKSTLLSLRNGGGKSVLVQMMTAPFVHKKYRNTKDRPFESYFTTAKPTFIMVEWSLDGGAGYCLTGMMVRRSQNMEADNNEQLEMVNFISEYKERCEHDIYHIPVVEKNQREMILKGFQASKQLFDTYKRDHSKKFFYYDMNQSAQQKQYFDKLSEYQINYKEWESIIKKVNERESGLSELFSDCKNEKELVEKWFLPTIESKMDKDKSRMKEFQNIVEKYVVQYKNNKSKIEMKKVIQQFLEEAQEIGFYADEYSVVTNQLKGQENLIACLRKELQEAEEACLLQKEEIHQKKEDMDKQIAHIIYEKMSRQIYELMEEETFQIRNRDMVGMEKDELEREEKEAEKAIHIYNCAKKQEEIQEYVNEITLLQEKLALANDRNRDLEPERKQLGGVLKEYYEECTLAQQKLLNEKEDLLEENHQKQEQYNDRKNTLFQERLELRDSISRQKETTRYYDRVESRFNQRYQEQLSRNIVGEYDPGLMEIKRDTYQKELEDLKKQNIEHRKQFEEDKEKSIVCQRALEDHKQLQMEKKNEVRHLENILEDYETQLSERRNIMKYFSINSMEVWNTSLIEETADKKIKEIETSRRELEKEEDTIQKEWKKLTTGKILELDSEIEEAFNELEIHYIYGMDWLNKNGYSHKENETLVKNNPFLPYSLILSQKELQKLKESRMESYTSFPVPMIAREQLEQAVVQEKGNVISWNGIHFFILFNEQLLDEGELHRLILQKEKTLQKIREQIKLRNEEYRDYVSKREKIQLQTVTKENYQNVLSEKENLLEQIQNLEKEFIFKKEEFVNIQTKLQQGEKAILEENRQITWLTERGNDYEELVSEYLRYLETKAEIETCRKRLEQVEEKIEQTEKYLGSLSEQLRTLELEKADLHRKLDELMNTASKYADYEKQPVSEETKEQIQQIIIRYEAITTSLSIQLQDLMERKSKLLAKQQKLQKELQTFATKYHLEKADWESVEYLEEEVIHQEQVKQKKEREILQKEKLWNDVDKKIAVLQHSIAEQIKTMQKQCDKEELLPKEEIQTRDYDAVLNQLQYQKDLLTGQLEKIEEKLKSIGENVSSLMDYADFLITDEEAYQPVVSKMNSRELREYKGTMLRDYRLFKEEKERKKNKLTDILNRMARKTEYQEDYFKRPLEAMLALTEEAQLVRSQLETTLLSYQTLLEKLEVDIVLIEQEKEKVIELLADYVAEVHQNLSNIDSNSTITVRDKSIKMLRIDLPKWEDNVGQYQLRLSDFMDEITRKGVAILEKNENPQEFIGAMLTIKNLYDSIVGIGNVQIKLYKIEEQREYQITWSEVARNSGGEGFLSAFVILSSLLYYMRKDESDIFAERNEGKVLLMDNPFAQTNAAHLLKPLMDMAKKTNTQLICLSGLGGDSIYGRFDNIFVLNLVNAGFRGGMQYLKGEHTRGSEEETVISSRIEVIGQQSLLF